MKPTASITEHTKPLIILVVYVVLGILWFYLSDGLFPAHMPIPELQTRISINQGTSFVLLSALLLYPLMLWCAKGMKAIGKAESEKRFRLIADSMPNLVWSAKPDGSIDYVNRGFKEYTGFDEYMGRNQSVILIHPDDRDATFHAWENAIQTGEPYEVEHRIRRHDGTYRWYLCRAIPLRDAEGRIIKWYGISTDVNDLKNAQERISRILDGISDGFLAVDRKWRITYFNRKAEEMSGLNADDMVGQNYWEVSPQSVNTMIETEYRLAMDEKKSVHFEHFYERYGRLLDVYVHPYADGIAIIFHDISDRERAAEALRSRTAELESLLLHAPIGFALFDREHRYLRVNKMLAEMNGISEENTLGKPIREVLPEYAGSVESILERVFQTGETVETEISGETPNKPGINRYWLTGFFPVLVSKSEPIAVGTYVVEITEHKRVEEAVARLAAIVEGAEGAIFSEDLEGILQTWNNGAERLFGYRSEEVIGKNASLIVPPDKMDELEKVIRKIKEGGQENLETSRLTKGGKRIEVSLSMSPIRNAAGGIVGISKIAQDISDRRIAEESLKETVRALERTNRDLRQFAHVASHDLQEPLRNVTRYVELLSRQYKGNVDEKGEQYIRFAVDGANRIHALVNDLLAFSEIGAKMRRFRPVSLQKVVEEVLDNLREQTGETRAVITVDQLPEVLGDRSQLVQLMQHLLGNALKFRKEEAPPHIHVSCVQLTDTWRIGIHDNGIGIEPEYFEKIFAIFQRLHSRSEYRGTGIGLAICRKIVEWHGGKIWVESTPGEGTSFYFSLPNLGGVL